MNSAQKKRKLNISRVIMWLVILVLIVMVLSGILYMVSANEKTNESTTRAFGDGFYQLQEHIHYAMEAYELARQEAAVQAEMERIEAEKVTIIETWETLPAGTILQAEVVNFLQTDRYFEAYEISEAIFNIINGKSYQENPYVGLDDLRYLKVLHYNFDHELQVGELIVAKELTEDFIGIFTELFEAEYEIQSLYLVDNYWNGNPTDTDTASIDENNSSCFMYRPVTGGSKLSMHSYGRAIDINPQQNPYVSYRSGSPVWYHENANDYIDRTTGLPHVITEEDVCYQIFTKYGFEWGGAWNNIKDYQHFEK